MLFMTLLSFAFAKRKLSCSICCYKTRILTLNLQRFANSFPREKKVNQIIRLSERNAVSQWNTLTKLLLLFAIHRRSEWTLILCIANFKMIYFCAPPNRSLAKARTKWGRCVPILNFDCPFWYLELSLNAFFIRVLIGTI